ncbi:MAG TPA: hypothetical protein VGI27_03935 [Solirubrobacteraceae bacterium]
MLLDRGLLVERDGAYHATASLDSLEVPESLHALIAARLDGLPEAQRRILQDAAVLGKSFTAHMLHAVTGVAGDAVEDGLRALVDKDLLSIQSDPRSPERGQYLFVQDLVRSVAYGTLARRDRKLRHLAAATYLESEWSEEDEVAEVVAAHLVEAHAAEPDSPDAAGIRERAGEALVRAGDHAASLAAGQSAQRYYERALELADDNSARINLLLRAGRMALMQARATEATAHFQAAIDACGPHDRLAHARALRELGRVQAGGIDMNEAVRLSERALEVLSEAPERDDEHNALVAQILSDMGKYFYFIGRMDEGLRRTEMALEMAERDGLLDVFAYALDTKGIILAARGRLAESEILELAAFRIAQEQSLPSATVIAGNAGATLEEADRPDVALALYEQGETSSRRLGDRRGATYNLMSRTQVLIDLGRWDEAAGLLAHYAEVDEPLMEVYAPGYMGMLNTIQLHVWRGDVDVAAGVFEKVSPHLADKEAEVRADLKAAHALLLNAAGDHEAAMAEAERGLLESLDPSFPLSARRAAPQAAEAAFALGRLDKVEEVISAIRGRHRAGRQPTLDAHILRWQARLAGLRGDDDAAVAAFGQAIDAFAAGHRVFWRAVTQLEAGESALRAGRADDARLFIGDARSMFVELRARPWIERADAAWRGGAIQPEPARSAV